MMVGLAIFASFGVLLVLWPIVSVLVRWLYRRGFPKEGPQFEGGEKRLCQAQFLDSSISSAGLVPFLVIYTLFYEFFDNDAAINIPFLILGVSVLFFKDMVYRKVRSVVNSPLLDELDNWRRARMAFHMSRIELRSDHHPMKDGEASNLHPIGQAKK